MIVKLIAKFWNPPIARKQLLGVAHLVQDLLVLRRVDRTGCRCWGLAHAASLIDEQSGRRLRGGRAGGVFTPTGEGVVKACRPIEMGAP